MRIISVFQHLTVIPCNYTCTSTTIRLQIDVLNSLTLFFFSVSHTHTPFNLCDIVSKCTTRSRLWTPNRIIYEMHMSQKIRNVQHCDCEPHMAFDIEVMRVTCIWSIQRHMSMHAPRPIWAATLSVYILSQKIFD